MVADLCQRGEVSTLASDNSFFAKQPFLSRPVGHQAIRRQGVQCRRKVLGTQFYVAVANTGETEGRSCRGSDTENEP